MKLILVRHGETIENQKDIIHGHTPGHLSGTGKAQVKKLSERLKDEKIDAIYSSDLRRAKDTALEIAKFHKNVPIYYRRDLRERNYGSLEGRYVPDVINLPTPDDVETRESVHQRAKNFLDEIYEKHSNDIVLFVGHNSINRALIAVIMNKRAEHYKEIEDLHNTSVSIFDIREDKNHKVILLNCAKHLE